VNEKQPGIERPNLIPIGIDIIDEQHQMLANMVYTAQNQLTETSTREEIEAMIHDLMGYALYHFETEEELMHEYHYDAGEMETHCEEHRGFSATIARFQQDMHVGKLVSGDQLLAYVKQWLESHTLYTDQKLGEFLRSALRATS